jgi:hypothetical protein
MLTVVDEVELILAEGFDERLLRPVDGDVLELEMLLRPGPAADAEGHQEEDNSFHSGVVLVILQTKIGKKIQKMVDIFKNAHFCGVSTRV